MPGSCGPDRRLGAKPCPGPFPRRPPPARQVAEHATGRAGRLLLEVCICASNLGCIVAYLNILADTLSSVAGTLIPPGAEPSRGTYMAGGRAQGCGLRCCCRARGLAGAWVLALGRAQDFAAVTCLARTGANAAGGRKDSLCDPRRAPAPAPSAAQA